MDLAPLRMDDHGPPLYLAPGKIWDSQRLHLAIRPGFLTKLNQEEQNGRPWEVSLEAPKLKSRIKSLPPLALTESVSRTRLLLGGTRVDLLTGSPVLRARVSEYFASYLACGTDSPAAEAWIEPFSPSKSLTGFWESSDPEFHELDGFVLQRDFVARVLDSKEDTPRVAAWLAPDLDDAIHNFLRWFLPPLLLGRGAFLMHATGVVRDGRGYVLFGQSGAGKSTSASLIARSDPKAVIVGDDAVIIRFTDGARQPLLESAPLGCGYTRSAPPSASAPLSALLSIHQARAHHVRPLSAAEGVASLLASAMWLDPAASCDERFSLAHRFTTQFPGVQRLQFAKDAGFWPLLISLGATT